jgi:hypothetical protein
MQPLDGNPPRTGLEARSTGEPRPCPACGYDLRGIGPRSRCPECGLSNATAPLPASQAALSPSLTRAEELEVAFSELGTAAAGTILLWAGCVWLPLLGPVAWAVVGLFAFWRLMGMRRLRALGVLGAPYLPYPVPHGLGLSIIEVSLAVPTILATGLASVGTLTSVLQPVATVLQALLIAATGGQLCVSALLAATIARREAVPSLRIAAHAALLLAPVGTLVIVPIGVQWLIGTGAVTGKAAAAISSSMTAIMLALGAGGIAASLALRYALHGLSSVVPSGVDTPRGPLEGPSPVPAPSPPEWAGDPDEPIPLVEEDHDEGEGRPNPPVQ